MRKKLFICVIFLACIMREAFAACIDSDSTIYSVEQFCSSGEIADNPVIGPVIMNDIRQDAYELPKHGQPSVWYCS